MVMLISLILVFLFVWAAGDTLRKHAGIYYLVCCLLSLAVIAAVYSGVSRQITGSWLTLANVLLQGGLAGAMFIFVMFAGAVPNKSRFKRTTMPVRAQLSIMASILTLGHNIAYGRTYFVYLFTQAQSLRTEVLLAAVCSLVMILIMIPLFITSFPRIRRKMQPKSWKRLQRLAYVFYCLMFIHVLLLNTHSAREGKWTAILNIGLYSLIFLVYGNIRLSRLVHVHSKERFVTLIQFGCCALMIGTLLWIFVPVDASTASTEAEQQNTSGIQAAEAPAVQEEEPDASENADGQWADGKYKGSAIGYNGRLTVSVTIEDGTIQELVCTGNVDDEPYISDAIEGVFAQILEKNSPEVDAVSSATTSSDALIEAVKNALEEAESSSALPR